MSRNYLFLSFPNILIFAFMGLNFGLMRMLYFTALLSLTWYKKYYSILHVIFAQIKYTRKKWSKTYLAASEANERPNSKIGYFPEAVDHGGHCNI